MDSVLEGQAVLLVGEEEAEQTVPASALPEGAGEGTWLIVRAGTALEILGIDPEAEEKQRRRVEDRLERLRSRGGERFARRDDTHEQE